MSEQSSRKGKVVARKRKCRFLVVIDEKPIRKNALKQFKGVYNKVQRLKQRLDVFLHKDQPKFRQWLHQEFALFLTELDDLEYRCELSESQIFGIKNESDVQDDDDEDEYREPDYWETHQEPQLPHSFQADDLDSRIKERYRMLVRRLHPDRFGSVFGTAERELWFQVQEAYYERNLEKLDLLLAITKLESSPDSAEEAVSNIYRATLHYEESLKALSKELRNAQKNPAWQYSVKGTTQNLEGIILESLNKEKQSLIERLAFLEETLSERQKPEEMPKKVPGRKTHRRIPDPFQMEFTGFA